MAGSSRASTLRSNIFADERVRVCALLLVASAIYCVPLFLNSDKWGREDWDQFTFRYDTPRVALLRDGVLPSWNPYANGGTVLLAHPDSPVLSPWFAIVMVLGAPLGLKLQVLVFMAVGAIGMAAFARRLGARAPGQIASGIVFMMSSHFALHVAEGHLEWCVLGLMPWVAWCVVRAHEGLKFVILGSVVLASVLTFGAVYIPAAFLPFMSVWVLGDSIRRHDWKHLTRWAAIAIIAALLAAVKLLPTVQFTQDWPRVADADQRTPPAVLAAGLLHPQQAYLYKARRNPYLPDGHFAKSVSERDSEPALKFLESQGARLGFHEYGCYIGVLGILCAALGAVTSVRRLWPLYLAGGFAAVVVLGASSPIDLWALLRRLPLYTQLHVPSRFLAAVLFALSIAAAFGFDAVVGFVGRRWQAARRFAQVALVGILYVEMLALGWNLLTDIFVMPPIPIEAHSSFANRFNDRSLYPIIMSSTVHPYLRANSGTLKGYENLSVTGGRVLAAGDPAYRGEAYLESGAGATIAAWTMSRVNVHVASQGADRVVLNQNFYRGWWARRRDRAGRVDDVAAVPNADRLVSAAVDVGHTEVEFFYVPAGFTSGAWISSATFLACLAALWITRRTRLL